MSRTTRFLAMAVLACHAFACKDAGPDPLACAQTYGFGNYGCADVTGVVLDSLDNPVANAAVAAGGSNDPYEHINLTAGADGKFAGRFLRRWIQLHPEMDTISTWVHATTPGPSPVSDSAFVQLRFYALGTRPTPNAIVVKITP